MHIFVHYINTGDIMYYFELKEFPSINRMYSVTRNTLWQISEKENMLILVTDGKCNFECDGENTVAKSGDLIFIPANTPYIRSNIEGKMCTMTYIHFTGSFTPLSVSRNEFEKSVKDTVKQIDENILNGENDINYPHTIYLSFKNTVDLPAMKELFHTLNSHFSSRMFMWNTHASACLCTILATLSQLTVDNMFADTKLSEAPEIPHNLKTAIAYINRNYSQPISLNDLAKHCRVSKQQMIRYFKKAFNQTPANYIIQYKITKAKEFLFRSPDLTIKEISAELGFDNQHYFTRLFKKHTGETPTHYRYRTVNYSLLANSSLPEDADL